MRSQEADDYHRHGWGTPPHQEQAVTYLSYAASNSAEIERLALEAGLKKGGAAKGELVLAIFELGNCFRHGWGVKKDAVAAKQYYETAANLGDTDAMDAVAWCYTEGFGCKKDKVCCTALFSLMCVWLPCCFWVIWPDLEDYYCTGGAHRSFLPTQHFAQRFFGSCFTARRPVRRSEGCSETLSKHGLPMLFT